MKKSFLISLLLTTLMIGLTTGCSKGSSKDEISEDNVSLTGDQILEKAQILVYDENGVCKTDGTTYTYMNGCYVKGASSNNYVWYNGFMWRIMGINYDNTIRLITDENVSAIAYGTLTTAHIYPTNEGYINDWLNEYFYDKLNSTKSIIQEGVYYCSNYVAVGKAAKNTECADIYKQTAKVGLISLDEYNLSGSSSSYLNIKQAFWTATSKNTSKAWHVKENGDVKEYFASIAAGIRPVINVKPSSIITSGNGTALNFYVLGEDKNSEATGTLSEKATSGEYILLEGKTYRIISKNNEGVKLILDGLYEESAGVAYTTAYGDSNLFTPDLGIGTKLNGDVLKWLGLSESDKIVETIYYRGDGFSIGAPYTTLLKQNNPIVTKVSLTRMGELLSGQSSTMLTNNYTTASDYLNTTSFWTMSTFAKVDDPNNTSFAWQIFSVGGAVEQEITNTAGIRPVITVKSDLNITGGTGTWNNPYAI